MSVVTHNVLDLLAARKSVRKFTKAKIESDLIDDLLKPEWPSSGDLRSLSVLFIAGDHEFWGNLVSCCMNQECVSSSAGVFLAAGDYWKSAVKYGWDRGIEYTVMEAGIALYHINVKAMAMGLSCCFVGGFHKESIRPFISPPHDPICMLAIGYGDND